jgi:hypothetical protein
MSSCAVPMSGAKVQSLKEILWHRGKKHSICGLLFLLPPQCVKYSPSNDVHRSSLLELGIYINHTIGRDECIGVTSETQPVGGARTCMSCQATVTFTIAPATMPSEGRENTLNAGNFNHTHSSVGASLNAIGHVVDETNSATHERNKIGTAWQPLLDKLKSIRGVVDAVDDLTHVITPVTTLSPNIDAWSAPRCIIVCTQHGLSWPVCIR